jgi:hypothetical protein
VLALRLPSEESQVNVLKYIKTDRQTDRRYFKNNVYIVGEGA